MRLGALLSGASLVAAVAAAVLVIVSAPVWIASVARDVHDVETAFAAIFGGLLFVAVPCSIAIVAGSRPGNVALRRRVLAIDDTAIWTYPLAGWWSAPVRLPWAEVSGLSAHTVEFADVPPASGPGPIFVPWDHLVVEARTDGAAQAIELLKLTASVEQIVEQARLRRPQLPFHDHRKPPPGVQGRVVRWRRRGSRHWVRAGQRPG